MENRDFEVKSNLIKSVLKLTRFWNLLIIALSQYIVAWTIVGNDRIADIQLFLLSLSTILIAAGGYVINDYYDVKIDLINKPGRVIVGKYIQRRYALLLHVLSSILGIGIGALLSWEILGVQAMSAFILWLYSNDLKRRPFIGNVVIALLTAVSIYLVEMHYHTHSPLIPMYGCFAFLMTLVREAVKDMEDLKGDNTFGCRTLPIVIGIAKTKKLIYVFLSLFAFLLWISDGRWIDIPLYYMVCFLWMPLSLFVLLLVRADTVRDYNRLSFLSKIILLLGVLSLVYA